MNLKNELHFIHANGFPPDSYRRLLTSISSKFNIINFKLRPLLKNKKHTVKDIKNWIPLYKDFIKSIENSNKIIGLGHSIGGNIILRAGISHPQYFSKIILLDPTLFVPRIIWMWRLALFLRLHNYLHPWVRATLKRKMNYNSYQSIFKSYRQKNVFNKINDENLSLYIQSITASSNDGIHITYPKEWEYQIYKTGLIADSYIWKNIKHLNIPALIIRSKDSNAFVESSANKIKNLKKNNIKIITLDDCTHLFPLEIPTIVSKEILNYLSED